MQSKANVTGSQACNLHWQKEPTKLLGALLLFSKMSKKTSNNCVTVTHSDQQPLETYITPRILYTHHIISSLPLFSTRPPTLSTASILCLCVTYIVPPPLDLKIGSIVHFSNVNLSST